MVVSKGMDAGNYSKCRDREVLFQRYPKYRYLCFIMFIMSNSALPAHGSGGLFIKRLIFSCIMQHYLTFHIDHWFRMNYLRSVCPCVVWYLSYNRFVTYHSWNQRNKLEGNALFSWVVLVRAQLKCSILQRLRLYTIWWWRLCCRQPGNMK